MNFSTSILESTFDKKQTAQVETFTEDTFSYIEFFENSLDMVLEENKEFSIIMVKEGVFLDAIKKIDFVDILSKILRWFIDAIRSLDGKLRAALVGLINKDPRIKMFKHKIKNYKGSFVYNKEFYIFEHLEKDDVSYYEFENSLECQYGNLIQKLNKLHTARTPMMAADILNDIQSDVFDEYYLDEIRGRVLGKGNYIPKEQFATELFKYFRPVKTASGTVTDTYIKDVAYPGYFDHKKYEKEINKFSTGVTAVAKRIDLKIKHLKISEFAPSEMVGDMNMDLLNSYKKVINGQCNRVKDICSIYTMYFGAKLDAIKDAYLTYRQILSYLTLILAEGGGNDG